MKVYVVTCNDFPDLVFEDPEAAEVYAREKGAAPPTVPRTYWRVHEIEFLGDSATLERIGEMLS